MGVGGFVIRCGPKHFTGVVLRTHLKALAVLSDNAFDADFIETPRLATRTLAIGLAFWRLIAGWPTREREYRNQRALKERCVA
jgi:hypothetical protein